MENRNKSIFEESVEGLSKEQLSTEKQDTSQEEKKKIPKFGIRAILVIACAAVFLVSGVILITQIRDQNSTNRQKDDAAKIYNDLAEQMALYGEGDKTENAASIFDASGSYIAAGESASERVAETEEQTESASSETEASESASAVIESTAVTETVSETEAETEPETETETETVWTPGPVLNEYLMPDTQAGTWISSMPVPSATLVRDNSASVYVRSSKGALIALQQRYQNSDIVAYLTIGKVGSTGRIENSVIEGAVTIYSDNDLYMDHDLYKHQNANGSLFFDCSCDVNLLNNHNTIIYGHHLSTGSTKAIFGHLDYFRSLDYLLENSDVTIQMGDAVYYYKVMLCATVDFDLEVVDKYSYTPMLIYNTRYASTDSFFSAYRKITDDFARLGKVKVIRYDGYTTALDPDGTGSGLEAKLAEGDRLLTLSTCYGELGTSSRCILVCKLAKVLLSANQ